MQAARMIILEATAPACGCASMCVPYLRHDSDFLFAFFMPLFFGFLAFVEMRHDVRSLSLACMMLLSFELFLPGALIVHLVCVSRCPRVSLRRSAVVIFVLYE